jgi:hypothetical protein
MVLPLKVATAAMLREVRDRAIRVSGERGLGLEILGEHQLQFVELLGERRGDVEG